MRKIKVELVYCPSCPALAGTRTILARAIAKFGKTRVLYREIDVHSPNNPPEYRDWPSPAILINGREFEGLLQKPGVPCREFDGHNALPKQEKLLRSFQDSVK